MHVPSIRPWFATALTTLLLGTATLAAGPHEITGRVIDPDGRPLSGARVLATGDGVPLDAAVTSADGRFAIAAPGEGRLILRIAAPGFRGQAIAVDAAPAGRDLGSIALTISAVSESIVVSATQVEVPLTQVTSSVTVLTGAELDARQIHTVADALRTVPGLTLVSTGGTGTNANVFPRGGESNFTLVVVDGVPVNGFGGDFDFGQLSTANVERLEIVRGPQSALYGANAIGGVVRLVTRRGGLPSAEVSAEAGQHGTARIGAASAGQRGSFEWGGAFDRLVSDGMNGELTAAGETIVNDDYERRTATLSGGWRGSQGWLRGTVRHSSDERGFPGPFGSNPIGVYGGIDAVARGSNDRTQASLHASLPVSSRVRLQAQTGYHRTDSDFDSQFGASEGFSRRWTGRGQTDVTLGAGLDLSAGVEVQRERAGSSFIRGASAQRIPVERSTAGYFAEVRWSSRDRLFATAGLRVEDIRRTRLEESAARPALPSDTVVSANPRLAVAWLARDGATTYTKIRGAAGTGIRPPDGFELAFTDNPGLRPERSTSVEAGVDQAFAGGRGLIEATVFSNEYDDLIVAVGSFSGSSRYRTDNIANARSRGFETALTLRGRVGSGRPVDLSGRVGYTFLDTEVLAVDGDQDAPPPFAVGQALLRRPAHQFFADVTAATGRVTLFLRGGGRSQTLDVEPSFGTFGGLFDNPGYQFWHAGGSWRVARFVEVFGRIDNLFDRAYEEAFGFPAPGRRASAGLRIAAGR